MIPKRVNLHNEQILHLKALYEKNDKRLFSYQEKLFIKKRFVDS